MNHLFILIFLLRFIFTGLNDKCDFLTLTSEYSNSVLYCQEDEFGVMVSGYFEVQLTITETGHSIVAHSSKNFKFDQIYTPASLNLYKVLKRTNDYWYYEGMNSGSLWRWEIKYYESKLGQSPVPGSQIHVNGLTITNSVFLMLLYCLISGTFVMIIVLFKCIRGKGKIINKI